MNHARQKRIHSYQPLEARQMLAGDVTVVEDGHLYIRGDAVNNQFEVVAVDDQLKINGLEGTTINGQDSYLVAGATVTDAGVSFEGGLRAHLGPGSDDLLIQDAVFESFSIIYGGTGDDNIEVVDTDFVDKVVVQTYDGDDSVSTTRSHFEGPLYILTLDGQDSVSLTDSVFAGDSFVVTGNHSDAIESEGNHYLGDINLVLPLDGNDTVQLNNPVIGEGQLGVFLGNGDDTINGDLTDATIDGTIRVGGQRGVDQGSMEMGDTTGSNVSVATVEEMRTLVFDNRVNDTAEIIYSQSSYFHAENLNYRIADDVQVVETQNVRQISWTGTYGGDLNQEFPEAYEVDDFTIEIYEGNSEIPIGDPIASFNVGDVVNREDTGITIRRGTQNIYSYSADIDVTLEAGKTYWVSIYGQVQDDVPAGTPSGDFVVFQWASRGTYFPTETYDTTHSAYTGASPGRTNLPWFDNMGGFQDFQLWS